MIDMSKKTTRDQAYRAAALEAALDAMAKAGRASGAERIELDPENVLRYAKFILGKDPAKKKRRRSRPDATGHLNTKDGRAYWAPAGEPLPDTYPPGEPWKPLGSLTEEPDATSSAPIGEDPGDAGVLLAWTEEVKRRNAEQEAALEGEKLEAEPEEKEEVDRIAERNNDYQDNGRPSWSARPEVRTVTLTPASSPVDKRVAEETMGLVPGALDEELTITNEGTFLPDGSPAEKAPREERDEALKRGRNKLGDRLTVDRLRRTGPLDEDELLAVAGSELDPAGDEEPSRDLKIRNRKGEVRTYVQRSGASGWTSAPGDPWSLHLAWTSSEMARRGPWHIV